MPTISILANTVIPSVDRRSDDTTFGAGTFSWQDPIHSWKAGPGEVMTVENLFIYSKPEGMTQFDICHTLVENLLNSLIAMIFLSSTPSSQNLKCDDHLWARLANHGSIFLFLWNFHRPGYTKLAKTTKCYLKFDPVIQTACQKEAYPESFINLGRPEAKWIHD